MPRSFSTGKTRPKAGSPHEKRQGFALLVTITLVAFLVLILVTLASLTRVETQVATNSQQQAQARQNAIMALNIAIGQLQKATGPDQRVTAPADITIPASVTIVPDTYTLGSGKLATRGTTGAEAIAAIDTYWAASRNRRWIGAWKNGNQTAYKPNAPVEFNPIPELQSWLVSGNENVATGDDYKPTDTLTDLTPASTVFDEINDSLGRPHRLLVKKSAGVTDAASLDRAVTAPQIPIKTGDAPGVADATIGHYAWWIGDEGVKARANLIDAHVPANGAPPSTDPADPKNRMRRQSAQRAAIEAMTKDGADGLAVSYPVNNQDLRKVLSAEQLVYLGTSPTFPDELKSRYHELTFTSRGVLADTRHGGLKADLSYILARPSESDFRTALTTAFHGANVAPSAAGNVAISTASTPYAEMPANLSLVTTILDHSATWEQLWSHANFGDASGVFDGDGVIHARLATATRQGITPIVVQGKVFYRLRVPAGGTVHVDIFPLVVLANPYPRPIAGEFIIRFTLGNGNPRLKVGTPSDPLAPNISEFTDLGDKLGNAGLQSIRLVVKATGIPAGEARIFSIDADENTTIADDKDEHQVAMINSYDPSAFLTYDTGLSIPAGKTHVGLYSGSDINLLGYIGSVAPENSFADISTRLSTRDDDPSSKEESDFRVFPMRVADDAGAPIDARAGGGGVFFSLHDGFNANPQQSPFYQLNYRSYLTSGYGNSSTPGGGQPLTWAIHYGIRGEPDQPYDTLPLPYFAANLLPPDGSGVPTTTRWGLVNTGAFPALTSLPPEITGQTGLVNLLYDLPLPGRPVNSIGQLQHFNLAGVPSSSSTADLNPNQWQVAYPIGNSYATPRVARDLTFFRSDHNVTGSQYDGSYLWNDILWDRFTFSSYPQTGDFDFDDPDDVLVNARYQPFRDAATVKRDEPANFRGVHKAAENLLVAGAFNVNSTSIDAWKAVLSGLRNVPVGAETDKADLTAPFPRIISPVGAADDAKTGASTNAWNGFRNLTQAEINAIAEEMVLQVRLRGPFLSLAQFVNRQLSPGRRDFTDAESPDKQRLGVSGALQSAIDRVINQQEDVPESQFNVRTRAWAEKGDKNPYYGDIDYRMPNRISGFPGYLLQGDVLSAIGPSLSARSDTFTIRTYGDTANPVTGDVEARAWCEAVVQRLPDYVDPAADAPADLPTATVNTDFGRRYQIVSFRWLSPDEI